MSALLNAESRAVPAQTSSGAVDMKAYDEEASRSLAIEHCNRKFAALDAEARVQWALENLPGKHVLTSSFGAQAAVSLHLVTRDQSRYSGRAGRYGLPVPRDLPLRRRA